MATIKTDYVASSNLTITVAGLATSSTLVLGREATSVDNGTDGNLDFQLAGQITTGTSPTAGQIEVWVVPKLNDSTWPTAGSDCFGGTDSAATVYSRDILHACGRQAAVMITDSTSDRAYPFCNTSLRRLFEGILPSEWTVFVTHNTAVNLNATGSNHFISITPERATST